MARDWVGFAIHACNPDGAAAVTAWNTFESGPSRYACKAANADDQAASAIGSISRIVDERRDGSFDPTSTR